MGSNLFLLHKSLRPSLYKPFYTTYLCKFIKRYSLETNHKENKEEELKEDFLHLARNNDPVAEEKASSADAKFETVSKKKGRADEEAKAGKQGFASQTMEKVHDGAAEAFNSDYKVDAVKNRYKEHEPGANYHKTGD